MSSLVIFKQYISESARYFVDYCLNIAFPSCEKQISENVGNSFTVPLLILFISPGTEWYACFHWLAVTVAVLVLYCLLVQKTDICDTPNKYQVLCRQMNAYIYTTPNTNSILNNCNS